MNHSFEIRSGTALALRNLYASHYAQYGIEANSIMDSDTGKSSDTSSQVCIHPSPDLMKCFGDVKVQAENEDTRH